MDKAHWSLIFHLKDQINPSRPRLGHCSHDKAARDSVHCQLPAGLCCHLRLGALSWCQRFNGYQLIEGIKSTLKCIMTQQKVDKLCHGMNMPKVLRTFPLLQAFAKQKLSLSANNVPQSPNGFDRFAVIPPCNTTRSLKYPLVLGWSVGPTSFLLKQPECATPRVWIQTPYVATTPHHWTRPWERWSPWVPWGPHLLRACLESIVFKYWISLSIYIHTHEHCRKHALFSCSFSRCFTQTSPLNQTKVFESNTNSCMISKRGEHSQPTQQP